MLTDYHLHLRPDDLGATPEEYFTEENVERYLEAAGEAGIEELGRLRAHPPVHRGARDLGSPDVARVRHRRPRPPTASSCARRRCGSGSRWTSSPGARTGSRASSTATSFDYVVGSVHFVRDQAVDWDVWDIWESVGDPDKVWRLYFDHLAEAARTGLYDILAHPDLVKVWGGGRPQPERDKRFYYEPVVEAVAETGIAVEVSTAGLRKPVGELYPATAFAEMCVDAGAAFALSSDAHVPGDVGHAYDQAVETMNGWGVSEIAVFERRERRMEPLG